MGDVSKRKGKNEGESEENSSSEEVADISTLECETTALPNKSLASRLFHWGPMLAIGVISEISMSAFYCHLHWWPPSSLWGILDLLLFSLWAMHVLSYLIAAANIGPGFVPAGWKPTEVLDSGELMQYCTLCKGFKAPRSHHCRKCERCVMKMDHHCPWINNCVGHFNHPYFVKFLLFAVVGCSHATIILAPSIYWAVFRVYYLYRGDGTEPVVNLGIYGIVAAIFALGLAFGVVLSVGFLLIIQLRSIWRNRSGIEDYILAKANYRRTRNKEIAPFIYPYNLGYKQNFREIFTWEGLPKGDGFWWPVVQGCTQFTLTEEQLSQKEAKRNHMVEHIVVRDYSGRICTLWHGIKVLCCQPFSDEPRIPITTNEIIYVSRWHKHWLYGQMRGIEGGFPLKRGWFPRCCVRKLDEIMKVADKKKQ